MVILFMIVFFVVSFLIVGLILLQEGKGGGIAAMGGGGMDGVMGVRNPLRRWTAYFAVVFVILALGINAYVARKGTPSVPKKPDLPKPAAPVEEAPGAGAVPTDVPPRPPEAAEPALPAKNEPGAPEAPVEGEEAGGPAASEALPAPEPPPAGEPGN